MSNTPAFLVEMQEVANLETQFRVCNCLGKAQNSKNVHFLVPHENALNS